MSSGAKYLVNTRDQSWPIKLGHDDADDAGHDLTDQE